MTTAEMRFSRPNSTAELLEKQYLNCEQRPASQCFLPARVKQEASALCALSRSMLHIFCENPDRSCAVEAAAVYAVSQSQSVLETSHKTTNKSSVVDAASLSSSGDRYGALMEAFIKFVTSDRDIPDGELLACLCTVLRCAPKESINVGIQPGYGQVVKHLTTLLSRASSAADVGNQYKVLRALSELLDAMNDFKFHGISDDEIAQPLYNLLKDAGKHDELRLSQAAHYAYQALRGIPTDVGPWNKAGKAIYRTLRTVALLASSVPTMSPEKLLEGGAEALDQLQGAAEMLSDIINELKDTGNTYNGIKNMKGKSQWYLGLRYTDLLIRGSAPKNLENMLNNENFPLKQDKNFLCGLCAQLERVRRDSNVNERMVVVLSDFLREQGNVSKSARVRQWVTLVNVDNFIPGETSKICRIFPHIRYNPRKYTDTIGYQASSIQTLGQELLNRAWESCHEVRLFYADQVIRDHYTKKALKLLEVERVGKNGTLAMDQCYINLAIVESNSAKEGESASSPRSSLGRRPAVPKPEQPRPISLPDLQLRSDNRKRHPNRWRVLIRGQAGMGKSTLCKRIVYDYIYHDVWADVIDRVIWLPLRHLKAKRMHSYSIKQLLLEYYFDNRQDDPLWETLCKEQDSNESKTLFILDGLDEAIQDSQLLQLLLCQPRVIITSRPYAIDPDLVQDLDLEVQTLGFYPEQMKQYINAVEPGNAVEIQNFLSARPAIHELARIPVQLDAICYSFEAAGFRKGEGPRNMTELYKAIELVMWRKDVVQLEIHGPGRLKAISKTDASGLADAEILPMVQGEINILQALAFDGFFCNRQEFDWQYEEDFAKRRDTLTKCLPEPKYPVASIDFQKISLLRTSDGGRARHNNYHFIHLTYQEYFAAQYFVQHWPCKTLPMVGLSAQDFLLKEKYNKRFDNMWRFVAGLLHANSETTKFFKMIEDEPYDLLGAAHHRLTMHCLAEAVQEKDADDFKEFRDKLESRIMQWFIGELDLPASGDSIGAEIEFPEAMYQRCFELPNKTDRRQYQLLAILQRRPAISSRMADYLISSYFESSNRLLKSYAIQVLSSHAYVIQKDCLHRLMDLLKDPQRSISGAAALALTSRPDAVQELFALLKTPDMQVQRLALDILTYYPMLPEVILLDLVDMIRDLNQNRVIGILYRQLSVKDAVFLKMLELLQDGNISTLFWFSSNLRDYMVENDDPDYKIIDLENIIAEKSVFVSDSTIKELLSMLRDRNERIRDRATNVLAAPAFKLTLTALDVIMNLLKDPKEGNLSAAEKVLSGHKDLPENVVKEILQLAEGSDMNMRSAAATILSHQELVLSGEILEKLVQLLDDPGRRPSAVKALTGQCTLPPQIVQKLLSQFKDPSTRCGQHKVLCRQSTLPDNILDDLADLLEDPDTELKTLAKDSLQNQPALPMGVVKKIGGVLESRDTVVQYTAMQVLSKQSLIPEEILHKMILNFTLPTKDTAPVMTYPYESCDNSLETALKQQLSILQKRTDLPNRILEDLLNLLGDLVKDRDIIAVSEILISQEPGLADDILKKVAHLSSSPNKDCKDAAMRIVISQRSPLATKTFRDLIPSLKPLPMDSYYFWRLDHFLEAQQDLPERIIQDLVDMLNSEAEVLWAFSARTLSRTAAISDKEFVSLLHRIDSESFTNLYRFWLREGARGDATWHTDREADGEANGEDSIIVLRGNNRMITLDGLKDKICAAQKSLKVPSCYESTGGRPAERPSTGCGT